MKKIDNKKFGQVVKELRDIHGWKISDIVEMTGRDDIIELENGNIEITPETLDQFAELFDLASPCLHILCIDGLLFGDSVTIGLTESIQQLIVSTVKIRERVNDSRRGF